MDSDLAITPPASIPPQRRVGLSSSANSNFALLNAVHSITKSIQANHFTSKISTVQQMGASMLSNGWIMQKMGHTSPRHLSSPRLAPSPSPNGLAANIASVVRNLVSAQLVLLRCWELLSPQQTIN